MRKNPRLLVVWWSNTGGTAQLVEAAVQMTQKLGSDPNYCEVIEGRCDRISAAAVLAADGYLFATPECLGGIAGPMKSFFDRCYYPVLGKPMAARTHP